ncbi:unnamed protein product [Brachionus calyciflorus]|uniref:Uncharacterized protein n=1 Tax=Brachionus calyciflorus TaxID=104777 RepID=A0A813TS32_9BILA|nr:unnamed protein product [Brachionus calyciflorus]
MKKIGKIFRTKLKEWAECSSIHAIPNISRNESIIIKILWAICFLIAMAYCLYGLTCTTISFFNYETNSQITFYRVSSIEFPTVSFCNKKTTRINNQTSLSMAYALKGLKYRSFAYPNFNRTSLEAVKEIEFYIAYGIDQLKFTAEQKNSVSMSLDEMLINCRFNDITCSKEDFNYFFLPAYGNCYSFSSKKIINSSGRTNGLTLELFLGYESSKYDVNRLLGAHFFIHNSSTSSIDEDGGFGIPIGYLSEIVINQFFNEKLPKPHGNCVQNESLFDSFLFKITVETTKKYEQKQCLSFCYQKYVIEQCKCYDPTKRTYGNYTVCNDLNCLENAYKEFYDTGTSSECFDYCPPECTSVHYNLQISQSNFPSAAYADLLMIYDQNMNFYRNFVNYENVKKSTLALNIYFEDIGYTVIRETPAKTFEQYFGEIGGFMGLCIGTSILSFVEIIELTIQVILEYFKPRNKIIIVDSLNK